MVDAQTISIIFAGVSMGVAAIYYTLNLRNTIKTRQAQLFMSLYDTYMDERYQIAEATMLNDW